MKLIKQSFEVWEQPEGLNGVYKQIERAGRICYRSEDKITKDSAKPFADRLIKSGHTSVLEHGTVYLYAPVEDWDTDDEGYVNTYCELSRYKKNPYSKFNMGYVTTNLRVLIENNWLHDLKYLCKPTRFHEKRVTVHFILDRSTANEFVRHRVFSFAQESQRFCNYSAEDKFGGEITYCIPCWMDKLQEGIYSEDTDSLYDCIESNLFDYDTFLISLAESSKAYMRLLELGWKPQQARAVLPNACKTELVMTGTIEQWRGFFELRTAPNAHPSARELAIPLKKEFINQGYIE